MAKNQCQHCGQFGHNRRGCPQIKEAYARVERLAEKYGIERSEEERAYTSTSWIDRINQAAKAQDASEDEVSWRDRWLWEEIADRKIAQARKNARGRTCGFCGERGHNARTCPAKKQHRKDADAMQGLAHRVVAACLSKAGIVPGALMRIRDWSWESDDYKQVMCVVTGINWKNVAVPNYDHDSGSPRHFDSWFKGAIINVRKPDGQEGYLRIPQNIKQQSHYNHFDGEPAAFGLVSGVVGGPVNKSNGWKGDNRDVLSEDASGVYLYGVNKDDGSGERIVDADLEPELNNIINEVSKWSEH
tara:strand:- start:43826 stop:44731 length:906 start_codon:yes stop_codon:yes gene_type:complete